MADWPVTQDSNRVTISSQSSDSIGGELRAFNAAAASAVWPTASKAIYIPFIVRAPFTAVKMLVYNGTVVSGNVDVGICDDQQNQLVHMGSTPQAGVSAAQAFDIADTALLPGVYYMAAAFDNVTSTVFAYTTGTVAVVRATGTVMQTGLTGPTLPSPAVFAAAVDNFVPIMAVTGRVLV